MSQKKIKIPAGIVDPIRWEMGAALRSLSAVLVGVSVLACLVGAAGVALWALALGGTIAPKWMGAPGAASICLAVVVVGATFDVLREIRRRGAR